MKVGKITNLRNYKNIFIDAFSSASGQERL